MLFLHHVMLAIPVASETVAREFYVDLLELTEIPKPDSLSDRGGLWLSTGTLDLHLGVDPNFHPACKAHVALQGIDLDTMRAMLLDRGIAVGSI